MKFIIHYSNSTTQGYSPHTTLAFSLVPRSKNASASVMQIGTPVLPTHQDEVLHRRGHHGKLPLPCTSNSSGRAGLPNNPLHQKVSSSKLAGNRHQLGWRHIGTPRTRHLRCILCHDLPSDGCRPNPWDKPTSPQAPGRAPANTDGTAAQISAAHHIWEEDVQT
jgi:hypothetical protein